MYSLRKLKTALQNQPTLSVWERKAFNALARQHQHRNVVLSAGAVISLGQVTLVSQDGDKFEVDRAVASQSGLVATMMGEDDDRGEGSSESSDDDDNEIPLVAVPTDMLIHIIAFCKHHKDKPYVVPKHNKDNMLLDSEPGMHGMGIVKDPYDQEFIKQFSFPQLMGLLEAVRFMDIPSLEDLIYVGIGSLLIQWNLDPNLICRNLQCNPEYTLKSSSLDTKITKAGIKIPEYCVASRALAMCAFQHLRKRYPKHKKESLSTEDPVNKVRILANKKSIHRIMNLTDLYVDLSLIHI